MASNWPAAFSLVRAELVRRGRSVTDVEDLTQGARGRLACYERDQVVIESEAGDQGMHWRSLPLCRRYFAAVFCTAFTQVHGSEGPREQVVHWSLGSMRDGDWELLGVWSQADMGSALPAVVLADLQARGVERIRFALGGALVGVGADAGDGLHAAALGMIRMPSIEQALAGILAQVTPRHRGAMACALRAVAAAGSCKAVDAAMTAFERGRWGEQYPQVVTRWRLALAPWAPLFALPAPLRRVVLSGDGTADKLHVSVVRAIGRHDCFASHAEALNFVASTLLRAERRLARARAGATTESRPYRAGRSSRPSASGFLSL